MNNFGALLKQYRLLKGKSIREVGRETGISSANLSRWESEKAIPNIVFCEILADYYGITIDELVGHISK